MKVHVTMIIAAAVLLYSFTNSYAQQNQAADWQLVWSDEFDGTELDLSKWSYQYGTGASEGLTRWGNAELQYYTDRADNIFVLDGKLHIVARKEAFSGMDYTSARIRSIHNGDWRYGRFEARIRLPEGQGIWPAFWMMPTDAVYGGWPASGELDIMEMVGHEPNVVHGTIHYGPPHTYSSGSYTMQSGNFSDDFNTFAIEWENGEIRWYVNDIHFHTETNWFSESQGFPAPFEQRFHFLLNVAVGGHWPGSPDATTEFPQQMVVDYIRVYQDANADSNVSMPLLFEDRFFNWEQAFTNFEGGSVSVVENPEPDQLNSSERVGKMVKDGGEFYGGSWFETERSFSFNGEHNEIKMKVWSSREDVPILVKLEQQDGDAEYETLMHTTASGEWENMTWTVEAEGYHHDWDMITLIFDFNDGQVGDGSENFTWYFDDLDVYGLDLDQPVDSGEILPVTLPLTFEDPGFNWDRVFTGFSGGEITVVENPEPDEVNSSNWVGKMVKDGGAFWGGAFMVISDFFRFDEDNHTITMKVWSPRAGVQVLMKVEQENGAAVYETAVPTSTSGEWEEMTWDMSGAGFETQWDIITLFFDFEEGQIGDGSANFTWYFDDVYVFAGETGTSVEYGSNETPKKVELLQNYPNPFNPSTQIEYTLSQTMQVRLDVYNMMGQRMASLVDEIQHAGRHNISFEASHLASGVYLYRIQAGYFSDVRKMVMMK
jgi:beta-glucanase (GH16 family)